MAQTFSGSNHLLGSSVAATTVPVTLAMWFTTSGGQFRRLLSIAASADTSNIFGLNLDDTSATNKVAAYHGITGNANKALTSVACDITGNWNHGVAVFAGGSSRSAYLNGGNKGNATASFSNPSGLNETIISGRSSDFTAGITGQAAHAAVWTRALSDLECAYLGAGGSPRALKGTVSYWKITSGESPVIDQIGSNNLTVTGTTAGTTNPNIETFFVGTAIPTQNYTVGVAISAINLAAGAGLVDDVSSAYTATLCQLGTVTQPATTASALTATREPVLNTTTGISANDWIKITSGGTPTRVLGVDAANNKLLVDADQTYSSSAQVFRYPVNPLSVSGLGISSNSFSGTPTLNSSNSLCVFKFTCNANSSVVAFSNLFSLNVTGGGGGGGGVGFTSSAFFNGGFQGG